MIEFDLPYPPSINRYWRNLVVGHKGRTIISREGRDYRDEVCALLRGRDQSVLTGRLAVVLELHPPDRRRRDLDNTLKATLDALTHAGVWLDDSQIDELTIRRKGLAPDGLMRVLITPLI
jgi:crossover junction endodeoxyribonuclease RusA